MTVPPINSSQVNSSTDEPELAIDSCQSSFAKVLATTDSDSQEKQPSPFFEETQENDAPETLIAEIAPPLTPPLSSSFVQSSSPTLATADLSALFEKMASSLIILHNSSETQTTLTLDHPQFQSSPFFGAQIVIKEFSTAPKAFNVEIISNPTAILMVQKAEEGLLSLFAKGDFGFSIHRLDTQIQQDPPLFSSDEEGQRGQKDQEQSEDESS